MRYPSSLKRSELELSFQSLSIVAELPAAGIDESCCPWDKRVYAFPLRWRDFWGLDHGLSAYGEAARWCCAKCGS